MGVNKNPIKICLNLLNLEVKTFKIDFLIVWKICMELQYIMLYPTSRMGVMQLGGLKRVNAHASRKDTVTQPKCWHALRSCVHSQSGEKVHTCKHHKVSD